MPVACFVLRPKVITQVAADFEMMQK